MAKIQKTRKPSEETGKSPSGSRSSGKTGTFTGLKPAGIQPGDPGETTIIVHTGDERGNPEGIETHPRASGVVHRAMNLLEEWGFRPARIIIAKVPVDIIAFRADMDLIVQVISSPGPLPDAKTIVRKYRDKIISVGKMGNPSRFRKLLMAHSRPCGWKVYDIFPGGLQPAWDLLKDRKSRLAS